MWLPFSDFPREMGYPQRRGMVYTMEQMLEKINIYNGYSTIFTSLYSFDQINEVKKQGVPESARIKQLYFETDSDLGLECAQKLHEYATQKDLLHTVLFSGRRGFHIYIATVYPNYFKNKKATVGNAQLSIANELGLRVGINEDSDLDGHNIGGLHGMVRVPNTLHTKSHLFCIPLSHQDLSSTLEEIQKKAQRQNHGLHVYGHKFLDLIPFDTEPIVPDFRVDGATYEGEVGIEKVKTENFPECIKFLLQKRPCKHRERFLIILYCRELGLPLNDTVAILKNNLDHKTAFHALHDERQPYWVYNRKDCFLSCDSLKAEGYCKSENCKGLGLYEMP